MTPDSTPGVTLDDLLARARAHNAALEPERRAGVAQQAAQAGMGDASVVVLGPLKDDQAEHLALLMQHPTAEAMQRTVLGPTAHLTAEGYGALYAVRGNRPEAIECAALRLPGADLAFSVARPGRHHDVIRLMHDGGVVRKRIAACTQGFLTTGGRFVDRREAVVIAREAGQIVQKHGPADQLFSEDMW